MADKRITNDSIIESQLKTVNTELKEGVFIFSVPMTINEFSKKIKKSSNEIISHFFKKGNMFNINYVLNEEQIGQLCLEYGFDFQKKLEVNAQNFMNHIKIDDDIKNLVTRPPIITIMGHVDHGKTTLIDKIRNTNIAGSESGGITQHTGAYQVKYNKNKITFLDTPGHEAFTAMRARGAQLTDIVVLVVAADDGVMPQTKEAIDHAHAAKVPLIVFINKMDKKGIKLEKIINELATADVVLESLGGDVQFVKGSALKGEGIKELFSAINLQAEMLDLKSNPDRLPIGIIIEAMIDKGRGAVATIIVENGSLRPRDFIVAGSHYGRIKTMHNSQGDLVDKALPGDPVTITGLNYTPNVGDKFFGSQDEKFAKKLADKKAEMDKVDELQSRNFIESKGDIKIYNIIIKADVQGTTEAIKHAFYKQENEEVKINIVRSAAGSITKSDILLAQASNATIFAFNIKPSSDIKKMIKNEKIEINTYKVIYKMIEDLKNMIHGMRKPKYEEKITGQAIIQKIIFFSKVGNIAGCFMKSGEIKSNSKIRLMRNQEMIYEGVIDSLQRGKDNVKKVELGKDFGTHIKNYDDIKEDDIIEAYEMQEIDL